MHDQQVSTLRKQINLTLLIDRWVSDTRLGDVWVGGGAVLVNQYI